MTTNNLSEVMKPYFEQLNIDPLEFTYHADHNKFISESFTMDDTDPNSYFVVISIIGNIGTITLGSTIDGINFIENKTLGQIMIDNNIWVSI